MEQLFKDEITRLYECYWNCKDDAQMMNYYRHQIEEEESAYRLYLNEEI